MTKWGFQKTDSNRKRLISNDGNKKNTFFAKNMIQQNNYKFEAKDY